MYAKAVETHLVAVRTYTYHVKKARRLNSAGFLALLRVSIFGILVTGRGIFLSLERWKRLGHR